MGIRHLNSYLKTSCANSIRLVNMADLAGKKIAVDISIYLYKYEAEDTLLESMYIMLSAFKQNNIIPIFVFDGKAPPEKRELIKKRKEDKKEAQKEYNLLRDELTNKELSDEDKQEILSSMDQLKKQIVNITKEKIERVKELIRAYGATYYDAPGEADELCAMLVIKKKVWACMSEDMDLFVYGCTRVLRYFSLVYHTAILYYMPGMLKTLKMTQQDFRQICVLSGTDYNSSDTTNLNKTLEHYKNYKKNDESTKFYDWLQTNTKYVENYDLLEKIYKMFDLTEEHINLKVFDNINIENGPKMYEKLVEIMSEEGFMFCKK